MPAAPSALKATATGCQQISLGWTDNSTNEDGFKIDRSPDGKAWTGVGRVSPDQTNYVDNLANPAQVRYYRVYAFNGQGNSAYSNSASADTGPLCGSPTPSPTPAQVTVTVSWVNTAGHTYKLYYGNTASGQYQYSVPAGAGPNYVLSGLTPLTTYYFALTAIASGVESGKSPEVVYTTTAQAQQLLKLP